MRLYLTEKRDINEHSAVRALLAYAVNEAFGCEIPEIEKTDSGKPFFPSRPDIHFSLSHSKHYVLCAISDMPTGCDIEEHKTVSDSLIRRVCSEDELRTLAFFDLWVLKESFIKLKGELTDDYRRLCFYSNGGTITAPDPEVNSRLYNVIDGVSVAVCSKDITCKELQIIDFGKVFGYY